MSNMTAHTHVACVMWLLQVFAVSRWAVADVGEEWDALVWPFAELPHLYASSLHVLSGSPSSALHAAHVAPLVCSTATVLFFFPSPLSISVFLRWKKCGRGKTMWLWLSAGACERMIKEPATIVAARWWGYLLICCFIWHLTAYSLEPRIRWFIKKYQGDSTARLLLSQPCPDIIFLENAKHG